MVSLSPRVSSRLPIDADANPFPNDETTPPVTKMNLVCFAFCRAGAVIGRPPSVYLTQQFQERCCYLPRKTSPGEARQGPRVLTPRRMSSSTRAVILSVAKSEVNRN